MKTFPLDGEKTGKDASLFVVPTVVKGKIYYININVAHVWRELMHLSLKCTVLESCNPSEVLVQ